MTLKKREYRDASVAVLGGEGFIGRELVHQLNLAGARAFSVGGHRKSQAPTHRTSGRISKELLSSLHVRPDVIFHLAGGASVASSIENPRLDFDLTVGSTVETLEYLRQCNPEAHLVYVSSAAIYGNANSTNVKESRLFRPVSPYGLHKKISEELCSFYVDTHSLEVSIVRPFSVYGPGLKKQLLWDALNKVDRKEPTFFGTGNELRDWVYISDLAKLLMMVGSGRILAPVAHPLDAGSGIGVSVKEILTILINTYAPGVFPIFLGSGKKGDPGNLVASRAPEEIRKILSTTPLKNGLERYVDWYRKEARSC